MKLETLKVLIKREIESWTSNESSSYKDLEKAIMDLLDLYEKDNSYLPVVSHPYVISDLDKPKLTYGDVCSCNPRNGGSGICGCTIANQEVSYDNGAYSGNWIISTTNFTSDDKEKKS